MAHNEGTEKKRRSPVGMILLILLGLLVGGAGYLYYSAVKAPVELDDPMQLAKAEPMSAGERFVFSAADQTVQVALDKGDIWCLILDYAGEDFMELINEELADYDLTVSGCAIHMDEEGLRVDLELYYKEIRLVAKVPCNLQVSGRHLTLSPTGAKLGAVKLPLSGLLANAKLEYDITLPVISDMTGVRFEQDRLVLTGSIAQDLELLKPAEDTLNQVSVFCRELEPLAEYLRNETAPSVLLSHLEHNPGDVEELYRQLFLLVSPEVTSEYLDERHGMTQRFLPEVDFAKISEDRTALDAQLSGQVLALETFFTKVSNEYNEKNFRLSDGQFLLRRKPFSAAEYGGAEYAPLFEQLDPEAMFLILVDAEDGFIRKTSSLYRMVDEDEEFTQSVDFNKTYILGLVLRTVTGDPYLMYDGEVTLNNTYSRIIRLRPLTEEDVAGLQVPGKIGVWTDR